MLALALIAGCGAGSTSPDADAHCGRRWLTVYSDLPLAGAYRADMGAVYDGEWLALHRAHKRAGSCNVQLVSLSDANPATGVWSPALTSQVAHEAVANPGAVAYIGDFDSGATATSLQITDGANMLQVSPWSPYVGFTDVSPADQEGDPQRFQSSGHDTFARLVPSDYNQARATVDFMAQEGVRRLYVLSDVSDPFDADIAALIAGAAPQAGVAVAGTSSIDTETNTRPQGYASYAATIAASHADAIVLGGKPDEGALALWSELHAALPRAKLFAPSTLAVPPFLEHLGTAAASTYVTSPILEPSQYPALGRRVLATYRRHHGDSASGVYALYGYDAMADILRAIRAARLQGSKPASVLYHFFHLGEIHGALGSYRIYPDGDISLARFDGYQVARDGQLMLRLADIPLT